MRNLKKFLALVLAMMMAFSLVVTASAKSVEGPFKDEASDKVISQFEVAVDVLTGMKVFQGDTEGNFRASSTITRAEVAAIIYRLITGDVPKDGKDNSHLYAAVAPFIDVEANEWYAGYVGYLWNAKIIKGSNVERTEFNPYGKVTGYEAMAMILRAMGYDQNDEFTGIGWEIKVGQTANVRGMLGNINTTNFGSGHFSEPARRDAVAEILFQAAIIPTVQYNSITGGYVTWKGNVANSADIKNDTIAENESLGKLHFGLTETTRIVVGNQATGESKTVLGDETSYYEVYDNGKTSKVVIDTEPYVYPGQTYAADVSGLTEGTADGNLKKGSNTAKGLELDHKTGLNMFGHMTTVWYNENTNHTYAWWDDAAKFTTVYTGDDTDANITSGAALADTIKAAGYSVPSTGAWVSDRYDVMQLNGTSVDGNTSISTGNTTQISPICLYNLVDNGDGELVIIGLNAEVAQINEQDTTSTTETRTLKLSTFGKSTIAYGDGVIPVASLTPDSHKVLGDTVEAWEVVGTCWDNVRGANKGNKNLHFYDLIKVEKTERGTVYTTNSDNDVTLSTGKTLKQSYLYNVVKSGVAFNISPVSFSGGVEYIFTLDHWGRYLGYRPVPDRTFVYATYGDYEIGGLGQGGIRYTVTGVDWDGKIVENQTMTRLNINDTVNNDYSETNAAYYNGTGADANLAKGYTDFLGITRKDLGSFDTTGAGNQIRPQGYVGYTYDADGVFTSNRSYGKITGSWYISSADKANGFSDVSGDQNGDYTDLGNLLVTEKTVFYAVSGTGLKDLKVKTYNGITDLLQGGTQVMIDLNKIQTAFSYAYFQTDVDDYNKVEHEYDGTDTDTTNRMVTKVILPADALVWYNLETAFYVHDETATGLQLAGKPAGDTIDQYEIWSNGTKGLYWIKTDGTMAGDTPAADTFCNLIKVDEISGQTIYAASNQTSGSISWDNRWTRWANQAVTYRGTTEILTTLIGDAPNETIYRLDNAKVVDLTKLSTHTACDAVLNRSDKHDAHNEFKTVKDIMNAISTGWDIRVSIVNDGINVSLIYVVDAQLDTVAP